ncbi:unnamed protein product [Mytilus edulis]|uniref:Uncharacterized protein n=1 Tax=Mytilus edulis TaxID=6550 RepID=A0A8S3U003_MYTED|nr:unnamed protein product [Mytilus edulis]
MSLVKIKTQISNLLNDEAKLKPDSRNPDIYIITDSKGRYLKPIIPGRLIPYVHIFSQKGANIHSNIVQSAIRNIKQVQKPIVFIWFGTCELSKKSGRFSNIIEHPYQVTEQILADYRVIKNQILQENNTASIVFLECPYFLHISMESVPRQAIYYMRKFKIQRLTVN